MNIIDFFITEQKRLHKWMGESVRELTLEEWNYMPQGNGNSIAFLVWHCVRTEDNILRFILQQRPPRWNEENWHETGCDGQASGRYDGSPGHWPGLYHSLLYAFW